MTAQIVKIGIIGAGTFGGYHANKCAAHDCADLVGIFDVNAQAARTLAARFNTQAYTRVDALIAGSDAVIVACPARYHGEYGIKALKAGKHVLAEKPLAATLEDANQMVAIAQKNGLVLQAGHQERFVARAIGLDRAPQKPVLIKAKRFGLPSARCLDVSVALDLMTHDIDLVQWLFGARPQHIYGDTVRVFSDHGDAARARLIFSGGGIAVLEASRAETAMSRTMEIQYPAGTAHIDFAAKTLEDDTGFGFNPNFAQMDKARDSLGAATSAFIASISAGAAVSVPGADGRDAVRTALVIDALGKDKERP